MTGPTGGPFRLSVIPAPADGAAPTVRELEAAARPLEWTTLNRPAGSPEVPDLTGRRWEDGMCNELHPSGVYVCTRAPFHTGRHAAGDRDCIVAVWWSR